MKPRKIALVTTLGIPTFFALLASIRAISRGEKFVTLFIVVFLITLTISAITTIVILTSRVHSDRKKLNKAIENNNVGQVKYILERQDETSIKTLLVEFLQDFDIEIETPISVALRNKNSAAFELLKNIPAEEIHIPLLGAIANKNKSLVDFLLKHGADVNARDKDGWTILMEATCVGNKEIVELLLDNGADVSIEDNEGGTVFDVAQDDILDFLENYQKNRSMVPNRQANSQTSSADDKSIQQICLWRCTVENNHFKPWRAFGTFGTFDFGGLFVPRYIAILVFGILGIFGIIISSEFEEQITFWPFYISALLMYLLIALCYVLVQGIKFEQNFVEIDKDKIKYSAFSEVYISKDNVLSLRSDTQEVAAKTTLNGYNKKQIQQIIKEFKNHNKTVIEFKNHNKTVINNRLKYTKEWADLTLLEIIQKYFSSSKEKQKFYTKDIPHTVVVFAVGIMALSLSITESLDKDSSEKFFNIICYGIGAVSLIRIALPAILKGEVYFDADNIYIFTLKYPWWRRISLPTVSKIKIESDNNLIFYNEFNELSASFDLDKMTDNDAQKFINQLSKRVPISIDPQIAARKNYILPDYAIKEKIQTNNRRRKVVETAELQTVEPTNKIEPTKRKIEADIQSATNDNKSNNRRLEL